MKEVNPNPFTPEAWQDRLYDSEGAFRAIGSRSLDQACEAIDPSLREGAVRNIADGHIFLLWAIGLFYQSGNSVPPELRSALQHRFIASPGFVDSEGLSGFVEDTFVPSIFGHVFASLPQTHNPCWPVLLRAAFDDSDLIAAISTYDDDLGHYLKTGLGLIEPDFWAWRARVLARSNGAP